MAQLQGNKTSSGGRLDGSNATAVTSANFAIGVGWGGTATVAVGAGSTDQRGTFAITASATTPAQATATVVLTFVDGAYAATPFAHVVCNNSTQAITDPQPTAVSVTTTALSWTSAVLPVATKVYTFYYQVVA